MPRFSLIGVLFVLFSMNACSEQSLSADKASSCLIPKGAFDALPQDVLFGTDLAPVDSFKLSGETQSLSATYHMEMGGATVSIDVSEVEGSISINRKYTEPGMPAEAKRYGSLCWNGSLLYGNTVRGKLTESGLLWLELESEHDFIPADFWMLLSEK